MALKHQTLWQVKLELKQPENQTMTVGCIVAIDDSEADQLNAAAALAGEAFPEVVKADPNHGPKFDAAKFDAKALKVVSVARANDIWSR